VLSRLQVHPDATLVEITDAYNRLKETWREDVLPTSRLGKKNQKKNWRNQGRL
jgi:hypothetical protein